ncbi:glucosamine-6-phosphate deaminase [Saliterribacillus persicus]|uniref:Glucosamine-6-phosphate deaminase n=1 Tax=Saliterribacillus persicus TaxID=930114 RepID=A0A368YBB4_9BACI|nr:glucosamine-6-phosphate deaminase [Saliterribacillus persicus]RCW77492.1 glucosamine-6-phosphate deaminase [Saliterribacillus persicus]
MKVIQVNNYEEMSKKAAEIIINRIQADNKITLGLATGGTPVQTYERLVEDFRKNHTSYKQVTTFNLDEYIGLPITDPNSYHFYMNKHLFHHIDIDPNETFIPNGLAENLEEECRLYDEKIKEYGGIDLQLLGLGENGHIGFNEPGTPFEQKTHVVTLEESTRTANARFFNDLSEVPTKAITMGLGTIVKSKEILVLVSGEEKRHALSQLLHSDKDEDFPASILKTHENVTIIATEDAIMK